MLILFLISGLVVARCYGTQILEGLRSLMVYVLALSVAMGAVPFQARGDEIAFNSYPNELYLSFEPSQVRGGPVLALNARQNLSDNQAYIGWVFREIVRQTDQIMRNSGQFGYVEGGDNSAYYTAMVLNLAVPHHESSLMHFRAAESSDCDPITNELRRVKNRKSRTVLSQNLVTSTPRRLKSCSRIRNQPHLVQLLTSYTGEDVGISQVNPRIHKPAMNPEVLLSVPRFANYGLSYLYNGYMSVLQRVIGNAKRPECSMNKDPYGVPGQTKASPHYNMVRATWAGWYNTGGGKICRFTKPHRTKVGRRWVRTIGHINDVNFKETVDAMLTGGNSIYHQLLPEGSTERAAFAEIFSNYAMAFSRSGRGVEKDASLKQILSLSEDAHSRATRHLMNSSDSDQALESKVQFEVPAVSLPQAPEVPNLNLVRARANGDHDVSAPTQDESASGSKKKRKKKDVPQEALQVQAIPEARVQSIERTAVAEEPSFDLSYEQYQAQLAAAYRSIEHLNRGARVLTSARVKAKGIVNIRFAPDTNQRVLATVRGGTVLRVVLDPNAHDSSWATVLLDDGTSGYISRALLVFPSKNR
jgi:hypothetical protein